MNLFPTELRALLPALYSQERVPIERQIARVKFFTPRSNWTWYATEGRPEMDETEQGRVEVDYLFFGWIEGHESEAGYFSLKELESVNEPGKAQLIERDLYFTPRPLGELVEKLKKPARTTVAPSVSAAEADPFVKDAARSAP